MSQPIESSYFSLDQIVPAITKILKREMYVQEDEIANYLSRYTAPLRKDLFGFLEYPYVDRVYRDSYSHYYSTKHYIYLRDCIRISLFDKEISLNNFRKPELFEKLQNSFLGFIVIRPLQSHFWGRSVLSPKALTKNSFVCCLSNFNASINGVKLNVSAFPHSSQDSETISCAETTIWSTMEYFGFRYPEYKIVLPSDIINTLANISYERQMPSHGLTTLQMSFAFKAFKFGVRIYSKKEYPNDFYQILSYYIESGIPIVGLISNPNNQGHAVLMIGREKGIETKIDNVMNFEEVVTKSSQLKLFDSADIDKKIVIIDDNYPPYQISDLNNITSYYTNPTFSTMSLYSIIVPLYTKIYLEAAKAKRLFINFLKHFDLEWGTTEIVVRLFLTSSRSFKSEVVKNSAINEDLKNLIVEKGMPKFVWICEISDKNLFKTNKSKGLVVFDATEFLIRNSLIFGMNHDKFLYIHEGKIVQREIILNNFDSLKNNLKGEWCQWKSS